MASKTPAAKTPARKAPAKKAAPAAATPPDTPSVTAAAKATPDTGRVDADTLAALMRAEHGDPFAVLGMHHTGVALVTRALLPMAEQVELLDGNGRCLCALTRQGDSDLFTGAVPRRRNPFAYRLRVQWRAHDGQPAHTTELEDPYRFPALITATDIYLLAEGTHHRPYEWLGAHLNTVDGVAGTRFAVWAPSHS